MARYTLALFSTISFVANCVHAASLANSCDLKVKSDGQAVGEMRNISGINTYLSYPPNKSTTNAILFATDIFGNEAISSKLLADSMAAAGYLVVMPDIMANDAPKDIAALNFTTWSPRHPPSVADSALDTTVKYMRGSLGVKKIGAVGYCFGGRYAIRVLAAGKGVDAAFVAHPTFVEAAEVQGVTGPLSIAAAEKDDQFPVTKRRESEDILIKKSLPYQVTLYSGSEHGFAVRAAAGNQKSAFAKQSAFLQAVRWFDEWLK